MARFLHTDDRQLGITRHFFSEGVQERFAQSRFDAIRELGRIAEEEDCFRARDLQDSGNELEICLPSLKDFIKKNQDAAFGMDFPFGLPRVLVEQESWKEFIITFPRIALV